MKLLSLRNCLLSLFLVFTSTQALAANVDIFFDLDRGGLLEGHSGLVTPQADGSQVLVNDINELPLTGIDLMANYVNTGSSFSLSITSGSSAPLFTNNILPGDEISLGLTFSLPTDWDAFFAGFLANFSNIQTIGTGGTKNISYTSLAFGDGGVYFDMWFNAADFVGAHTFIIGVPEVPVPAAAWLFGSALIGLIGAARKKRT